MSNICFIEDSKGDYLIKFTDGEIKLYRAKYPFEIVEIKKYIKKIKSFENIIDLGRVIINPNNIEALSIRKDGIKTYYDGNNYEIYLSDKELKQFENSLFGFSNIKGLYLYKKNIHGYHIKFNGDLYNEIVIQIIITRRDGKRKCFSIDYGGNGSIFDVYNVVRHIICGHMSYCLDPCKCCGALNSENNITVCMWCLKYWKDNSSVALEDTICKFCKKIILLDNPKKISTILMKTNNIDFSLSSDNWLFVVI